MRDFDSNGPKKGYENAPRITAAQMDRFLHEGLGAQYAEKIASLINASQNIYAHAQGIDFSTDVPEKPAYLPIKRKVRVEDLEVGCVLRYCGNPPGTNYSGNCGGALKLGDLHRVTHIEGRVFLDVPGWERKDDLGWTETGIKAWEFVSNPNYVHGFRIGETVYRTDESWMGAKPSVVTEYQHEEDPAGRSTCRIVCVEFRGFRYGLSPVVLTRDPTKAYGYKAPVEYKVKDGVAKEGDTVWWLCTNGDPEKVTVSSDEYAMHMPNLKRYPDAYQLREPQKVWDYKNK